MPETVERSVGADMVQEVGTPASVQESAGMRCLLVFRHRLLEFRIAELRSLAEMNGLVFVQSSDMDVRQDEAPAALLHCSLQHCSPQLSTAFAGSLLACIWCGKRLRTWIRRAWWCWKGP